MRSFPLSLPDNATYELETTHFVENATQVMNFVVVNRYKNYAILAQELFQQHKPRIHHAQPAVVTIQRLAFLAHHVAHPLANLRAVYVVVVNPPFVDRKSDV